MVTSIISAEVLQNFTESDRYMMIEDRNIIHMNSKPLVRSLSIYKKTIVASIFAKIVNLNDLTVGILSLRTLDECNLNIAIDEHDSTKNTVIDPELVRWIIDETLCLRSEGGVATYQSYLEDQLQLHH